jgi:hypothetical protein
MNIIRLKCLSEREHGHMAAELHRALFFNFLKKHLKGFKKSKQFFKMYTITSKRVRVTHVFSISS